MTCPAGKKNPIYKGGTFFWKKEIDEGNESGELHNYPRKSTIPHRPPFSIHMASVRNFNFPQYGKKNKGK